MRKIRYGLNEFLPVEIPDLIQEQSEDESQRESEDKIKTVKDQCVLERIPERLSCNELLEVFERKRALAEDIAAGIILTESEDITEHRYISEDDVINYREKEHDIKLPVDPEIFSHSSSERQLSRIPLRLRRLLLLYLFFLTHFLNP